MVTVSSTPTDAGLQTHVSAGRAEPREELHPLQAKYWEAKPAREPGQSAEEVPAGRWGLRPSCGEREKPLSPGSAGFGGTLTAAPWSPAVGWAELLVTPRCPGSQPWISHLNCMLGSRKSPAPSVPSAGAARGSQGALGEQLPLLPDALQPRCLVRQSRCWGSVAVGMVPPGGTLC